MGERRKIILKKNVLITKSISSFSLYEFLLNVGFWMFLRISVFNNYIITSLVTIFSGVCVLTVNKPD